MDGVQWRHCLSDAAIIPFPLGRKERDTLWILQRRLSNITEHHQRHDGGDPLLALKAIKCSDFQSLQPQSHSSLHVLIKKMFLQPNVKTATRTKLQQ